MKSEQKEKNPRLGKVGGEAVLEGVMMRAGENCAVVLRREDGGYAVRERKFVSLRKKHKILNLPLIRGVIAFVESLILSYQCLSVSADVMGGETEESAFEKWFRRHLGVAFFHVLTVIAAVLGVGLALGLFLALPREIAGLIESLADTSLGAWKSAVEGGLKIVIFILYLWIVSGMKDIRRTFAYHGAEHKSIACYESGDPLTPEYARRHTRFHPRCGTSFMFVMILLGVLLGFFVNAVLPGLPTLLYTCIRILLLPVIVGVGFEFILYAGRHDNFLTRILSAPGLWMQRITTREPDDAQLEVALLAIRFALPEDFPDFDRNAYAPLPFGKNAGQPDSGGEENGGETAPAGQPDNAGETAPAGQPDSGGETAPAGQPNSAGRQEDGGQEPPEKHAI